MTAGLAAGAAQVLDLLNYIEQVEKLKTKPAFSVPTEFFVAHQHELKGLPELQLNLQVGGDDVWLRLPRLQEQGDQFGQRDLEGVRRPDAAERPLQPITGRIGLGNQLVGWRRRGLCRPDLFGRSTQRVHRCSRDLSPAGQQGLNLLGAVGLQLAQLAQRAVRVNGGQRVVAEAPHFLVLPRKKHRAFPPGACFPYRIW